MAALRNLHAWVTTQSNSNYVADLAYTLSTRRSWMSWRYTFLASTHQETLVSLASTSLKVFRTAKVNRIAYIFTGQGAQWFSMAREMLNSPRFLESTVESDGILARLNSSWSLIKELTRDKATSRVGESMIGLPATTAIRISLVELLRHVGVDPEYCIGSL